MQSKLTYRAYTISGHSAVGPVDYSRLFRDLAEGDPRETMATTRGGSRYLLDELRLDGTMFTGLFVSLLDGELETYFNTREGVLEQSTPPEGKVVARVARIYLDVDGPERVFVLELRREGVTAKSVEQYLAAAHATFLGSPADFTLVPRTRPSAIEELDALARIQSAELRLSEPNKSFRDWDSEIGAMMEESRAHKGSIKMTARRRDSLAHDDGIVQEIKDQAARRNPTVEFRVVGTEPGSRGYTTVSSADHAEEATAEVRDGELAAEVDVRALGVVRELINRVKRRSRGNDSLPK